MKVRIVKSGTDLAAGAMCQGCGRQVGEKIPVNPQVRTILNLASNMGLEDFDRTFDVPGLYAFCAECVED